jgi:hypothetical protein
MLLNKKSGKNPMQETMSNLSEKEKAFLFNANPIQVIKKRLTAKEKDAILEKMILSYDSFIFGTGNDSTLNDAIDNFICSQDFAKLDFKARKYQYETLNELKKTLADIGTILSNVYYQAIEAEEIIEEKNVAIA